MAWQPPTEEAFNDWVTPAEFLALAKWCRTTDARRRWLLLRLKEGIVVGVGRTGPTNKLNASPVAFAMVEKSDWEIWGDIGPKDFWDQGDAVFDTYGATGYRATKTRRFLDVRFDPASFNGKVNAPVASPDSIDNLHLKIELIRAAGGTDAINAAYESLIRTGHIPDDGIGQKIPESGAAPAPELSKRSLPKAEAERVANLILQFHGSNVTETRAFDLAKGMCPEYQVSRDPFLTVFRAIRGPKKRGRVPLSEE